MISKSKNEISVIGNYLIKTTKKISKSSNFVSKTRIPKLIHQTNNVSSFSEMPCYIRYWAKTWNFKNLGFQHIIWDDKSMYDMVKAEFGNLGNTSRILEAYERLPFVVQKSDFFRYLVVLRYGGVYSDIDTECIKSIDEWVLNYDGVSFITGVEYWDHILQWTFAAIPNHPFFKLLVDHITERILSSDDIYLNDIDQIVGLTGPGSYTNILQVYLTEKGFNLNSVYGNPNANLLGDTLVHSVTGFSPQFGPGSEGLSSPKAMVAHKLNGSWKKNWNADKTGWFDNPECRRS